MFSYGHLNTVMHTAWLLSALISLANNAYEYIPYNM